MEPTTPMDDLDRQQIVLRHLKLLYRNASILSRRIPSLDRSEAISSGYIGLSQAIDRFEPALDLLREQLRIMGGSMDGMVPA